MLSNVKSLIASAKETVIAQANSELVLLNWKIGKLIKSQILMEERSEYGEKIVATLSLQLGWSHFIELIPMSEPIKREFYAALCMNERWSVRTLRGRIQGMLFERTAISKQPKITISNDLEALRKTGKPLEKILKRRLHLAVARGKDNSDEKES